MESGGRPEARELKRVDCGAGQPCTASWIGMGPASRDWIRMGAVERGRESAVVRVRARERRSGRVGCIVVWLCGLAWGRMLAKRVDC